MEILKNIFVKIAIFDLKAIAFLASCYLLIAIAGKVLNLLHKKGLLLKFYDVLNADFAEIMSDNEIMDFFLYAKLALWRYFTYLVFPPL